MSLPSLASVNTLCYRIFTTANGVSGDVSETSPRCTLMSFPVGLTVGIETPKTSKTPIFNLLSDIIQHLSLNPFRMLFLGKQFPLKLLSPMVIPVLSLLESVQNHMMFP